MNDSDDDIFYDQIEYNLRCNGKRHIVMRENKPNQTKFNTPPYDPTKKYIFRTDENGFVEPSKIHENSDLNIFSQNWCKDFELNDNLSCGEESLFTKNKFPLFQQGNFKKAVDFFLLILNFIP